MNFCQMEFVEEILGEIPKGIKGAIAVGITAKNPRGILSGISGGILGRFFRRPS